MGKTAYLCEQLMKFVAAGKLLKKVLLVVFFFSLKKKKLLHATSTVALPRQDCGPSIHLPVLAEPPLLLSLSFFNTTVCSHNCF